jgi:hypothetical protein
MRSGCVLGNDQGDRTGILGAVKEVVVAVSRAEKLGSRTKFAGLIMFPGCAFYDSAFRNRYPRRTDVETGGRKRMKIKRLGGSATVGWRLATHTDLL